MTPSTKQFTDLVELNFSCLVILFWRILVFAVFIVLFRALLSFSFFFTGSVFLDRPVLL